MMDQRTVEALARAGADWVNAHRGIHGAIEGENAQGHIEGLALRFGAAHGNEAAGWFESAFRSALTEPSEDEADKGKNAP